MEKWGKDISHKQTSKCLFFSRTKGKDKQTDRLSNATNKTYLQVSGLSKRLMLYTLSGCLENVIITKIPLPVEKNKSDHTSFVITY